MATKVTAPAVRAMKGAGAPIVCLTAYDAVSGALADSASVDVILVGDSVGNVVLGYETTLPVTMEDMLHHVSAVRRSVKRALLVADMPFGSYQTSPEQAVDNAVRFVKVGAEAVKLEGGYTDAIEAIHRAGIPVMGHVGMTPQSVNSFGGFKVQGKGESGELVKQAALAIERAGAFSVVLELIPADLAKTITSELAIPTIGIGAGIACDGQIQVFNDILGLSPFKFKHAKRYFEAWETFGTAIEAYSAEVREKRFPGPEHSV